MCNGAINAEKETEIEAIVTAYGPEGGNGDFRTSRGVDVRRHPHGIASDPKLIPYGSRVSVPGYALKWANVDDTGAAMRKAGRKGVVHIDVRFGTEKEAIKWGRQKLKIKVIYGR